MTCVWLSSRSSARCATSSSVRTAEEVADVDAVVDVGVADVNVAIDFTNVVVVVDVDVYFTDAWLNTFLDPFVGPSWTLSWTYRSTPSWTCHLDLSVDRADDEVMSTESYADSLFKSYAESFCCVCMT